MFDIGFWEMAVIAVVALLVVGPRELPAMLRGISTWARRARAIASEFKNELGREAAQAEELKRLVERETEIAELHKLLDETRAQIPLDSPQQETRGRPGTAAGDAAAARTDEAGTNAESTPPGRDRDARSK
jgi:sec-independent protein translocase protein TatB